MTTTEQIGYTIQVPFKVFGNPAVFWNLIRRNIMIGILPSRLNFDKDAAYEVSKQLVNTLNTFTSRARFNAEGLQKDGQEPIDQVYEEWTKSLDFFVTLNETEKGVIRFDLGIKEANPWRGLMLEKVNEFYAAFYLTKNDKVVLRPSIDKIVNAIEFEDYHDTVGVVPYYVWNQGAATAPGTLPSVAVVDDIVGKVDELAANLNEEFTSFSQHDAERLKSKVQKQLDSFSEWSGSPYVTEASIFARLVPSAVGNQTVVICITARGDFNLNFYLKVEL